MAGLGAGGVLLVIGVALFAAGAVVSLALWAADRQARRGFARAALDRGPEPATIAFLFEDETVMDATPEGLELLDGTPPGRSDWTRLATLLRHRFPGLDDAMSTLAVEGRVDLLSPAGTERLRADWLEGRVRLALLDGPQPGPDGDADRLVRAALEGELQALRAIVEASPVPAWTEEDGQVTWANGAYFALAQEVVGPDRLVSWPPPRLFQLAPGEPGQNAVRLSLEVEDGTLRWFDCHGARDPSLRLRHAVPADAAMRAEEQLREFVQVLGKTFATLPVGLAVFDKARRLVLFNPALIDLTTLDVGFLSARPTLGAFLDLLRDKRRMPEPRDYRNWKQRMQALESAASGGFVQETWTLPTGQTYRVTGRPHPDGAIAFVLEDVSSEVSLTRHFRAEVELGHNVLDVLEDAVAVFGPNGTLSLSNSAYARLWGVDPRETLAETSLGDSVRLWEGMTSVDPGWRDLAAQVMDRRGDRLPRTLDLPGPRRQRLRAELSPMSGGNTVIVFRNRDSTEGPAGDMALQEADSPARAGVAAE